MTTIWPVIAFILHICNVYNILNANLYCSVLVLIDPNYIMLTLEPIGGLSILRGLEWGLKSPIFLDRNSSTPTPPAFLEVTLQPTQRKNVRGHQNQIHVLPMIEKTAIFTLQYNLNMKSTDVSSLLLKKSTINKCLKSVFVFLEQDMALYWQLPA